MFNANDFINWANSSKNSNSEMNDFRSTHHNPMRQVNLHPIAESEEIQEYAIGPVITGMGRAVTSLVSKKAVKKVGKEIAKDAAITIGTNTAKKALSKKKPDGDLGTGVENEMKIEENIDIQEIAPLVALGAGALVGAGVGAGVAMRNKQKRSIQKRADASGDAYDHSTERPYNFGDKRREAKAEQQATQQNEGLVGTLAKGALAGAAAYGVYKGAGAIHSKWKAKRQVNNMKSAEDTPSTPADGKTSTAIEAGKAKIKNSVINRVKNDPTSRDIIGKGMNTASKGLGKASGWLAKKASELASNN